MSLETFVSICQAFSVRADYLLRDELPKNAPILLQSLSEAKKYGGQQYEKYTRLAQEGQPSENYFGCKPDLLLMDGGRGQVGAAKQALAGTALADVPLYGMVKDDHTAPVPLWTARAGRSRST